MVRVTCLSSTKATLTALQLLLTWKLLIFNLQTSILLLEANIEQPYKANKKYN